MGSLTKPIACDWARVPLAARPCRPTPTLSIPLKGEGTIEARCSRSKNQSGRKHLRNFVTLIAAAALAVSFAAASHAEDTLKFGVAAEPYPPFTVKGADGK